MKEVSQALLSYRSVITDELVRLYYFGRLAIIYLFGGIVEKKHHILRSSSITVHFSALTLE